MDKRELVALEDVEGVLTGLLEDALTDSRNPMKVVEAILADIRALPRHNGEVERLREAVIESADKLTTSHDGETGEFWSPELHALVYAVHMLRCFGLARKEQP